MLWSASAMAQATIAPPLVGFFRDSRSHLRRIFGVRGAFILGKAEISGVESFAFSGRFGLVKTELELLILDEAGRLVRSEAAPAGAALFAFDSDGAPALCY